MKQSVFEEVDVRLTAIVACFFSLSVVACSTGGVGETSSSNPNTASSSVSSSGFGNRPIDALPELSFFCTLPNDGTINGNVVDLETVATDREIADIQEAAQPCPPKVVKLAASLSNSVDASSDKSSEVAIVGVWQLKILGIGCGVFETENEAKAARQALPKLVQACTRVAPLDIN